MTDDWDPIEGQKYQLPWEARAGRWWRRKREAIGLIFLISVTAIAYAHTNWFNDLS